MSYLRKCRTPLALALTLALVSILAPGLTSQANASVMYATFTGVIENSNNQLGLFGTSDSLDGQEISLLFTYDTEGGQHYQVSDRSAVSYTTMTVDATIAGQTESVAGVYSNLVFYDFRYGTAFSQVALQDGFCCGGAYSDVGVGAYDPTLGLPHALDASYSFDAAPNSWGHFYMSQYVGADLLETNINFLVTHVSISSVTPVPLPGGFGLFLSALVGAGWVLRRRPGSHAAP